MGSVPGIGAMPPGRPQASPDTLVGAQAGPPPEQQRQQDKTQDLMSNVKVAHGALDALAAAHPEMADVAEQCKKALTNQMMSVVGQTGSAPTRGIAPPG